MELQEWSLRKITLRIWQKLETAILDEELRKNIGENANKWVIENHSWDVISQRVHIIL